MCPLAPQSPPISVRKTAAILLSLRQRIRAARVKFHGGRCHRRGHKQRFVWATHMRGVLFDVGDQLDEILEGTTGFLPAAAN